MDRVVFRSNQDPEFRGDLGIGRELAELGRCAPRLDAQEDQIHVASFEDINFEHRRPDLHGKIVFRHQSDAASTRQGMRHIPSLLESPSRGPQENDDQPRPLQSLLRLSVEPVNGFDLVRKPCRISLRVRAHQTTMPAAVPPTTVTATPRPSESKLEPVAWDGGAVAVRFVTTN